ncbi:TPA: RelA/SpoT domain-containing protein [Vibrio parahaemolyticus]|nr:RelA/SpoT domain-containing protein [Vibrio parahaemolyticus]
MSSHAYQNHKKELKFSKKSINNAADLIRKGCTVPELREEFVKKIQNFREAHLYPLMLMKNHLVRTAVKLDKKVIVARRLKRLETIVDKLERPTLDGKSGNSIKLTRMQDIGGCRAIVKDLSKLKELQKKLVSSRSVHKIVKVQDYLNPKKSGYGGVHLIYSCFENQSEQNPPNQYKKLKIELQLRTQLQHAWATSLEMVDLMNGFNLKTSMEGNEDWREFFSLAGRMVAFHEGAIEMSPLEEYMLRTELMVAQEKTNAIAHLARATLALASASDSNIRRKLPRNHTNNGMYLIKFWSSPKKSFNSSVEHFSSKRSDHALVALEESESDPNITLSVLVSSENVTLLRKAYPNYFGSSTEFIAFLKGQIKKYLKVTSIEGSSISTPISDFTLTDEELRSHHALLESLRGRI